MMPRGVWCGFGDTDSATDAAFFVTEEALQRVQPGMRLDEAGLLRAFDANRDLIQSVAARVSLQD